MAEPFVPVFALAAAPFAGSLIATMARRVESGGPYGGRSRCDHCHAQIPIAGLVPIASFMAQSGRCRACAGSIGRDHLACEILALAPPLLALFVSSPAAQAALIAIGWLLLQAAAIDLRMMRLPFVLSIAVALIGLASVWLTRGAPTAALHLATGVLAYAALASFAWLYGRMRGRLGLGGGDVMLIAAGFIWLGPTMAPYALSLAALGGLAFAMMRVSAKSAPFPFGPFIAGAFLILGAAS